MNDTTRKRVARTAGAALIAAVLTSAAPAVVSAAPQSEPGGAQTIELRRDSQAAAPFVAEVSPELDAAASTASGEGFDWTDAAIGAGGMLALVAIGLAAAGAWRRPDRPRTPAGVAGVG